MAIKKVNAEENEVTLVSSELEDKIKSVTNDSDAEVILVNEEKSNTSEEVEDVVLVKPAVVQEAPQKMVKIFMKVSHKCHIGGEWYALEKGKHYNVPENVKDILSKADLLQPL